jgi:hypothetical protein
LTTTDATSAVQEAIRKIVPDADFSTLPGDAALRDAFELDSLDFLSFVELLSTSTGRAITEDDYPKLRSLDSCVAFLAGG